ncbi:hypothetical protein CTAYLR_004994 [Chrysophaeum taylorii]|uniref:Ionotropic glutamate receptor C-terminal domain-containing protein n=1 Tax=Chrysophaeum taylorii TaxID=2483200 RepID=A0AAD7UBJ1_9STRA|nr:hypothetical protein CTAYLR_004994 [Chrysophaeum taylorii]
MFFLVITVAGASRLVANSRPVFDNGDSGRTDYRYNMCNRTIDIATGALEFEKGLDGIKLTVIAYYRSSDTAAIDYTNDEFSGLQADVLEEIANLAGFEYELYLFNESASNSTYVDDIEYMMRHYDVAIDSTTAMAERAALGFSQPYSFLDMTPWLVTTTEDDKDNDPWRNRHTFFRFAYPFSIKLWAATVFSTAVTAFAYWYIEREGAFDSAHKATLQVAAAGGLEPTTVSGKMLLTSWAMAAFIIISSYTANLAAVLVSETKTSARFSDINDAIDQGAMICVHKGYATESLYDSTPEYPPHLKVSTVDEFMDMYRGVCDAVLTDRWTFELAYRSASFTPSCKIARVGDEITDAGGGWVVYADYRHKCSSLITQVLAEYFLSLEGDGTLDTLRTQYLDQSTTKSCGSEADPDEDDVADRLQLHSFVGVFMLHYIVMFLAVLGCWYYRFFFHTGRGSIVGPRAAKKYDDEEEVEGTLVVQDAPVRQRDDDDDDFLRSSSSSAVVALSRRIDALQSDLCDLEIRIGTKLDTITALLTGQEVESQDNNTSFVSLSEAPDGDSNEAAIVPQVFC